MAHMAVFFDRDGTLIHDPGYLNHPDQVRLLEGAAEMIRDLRALGYKIVIVTNQSAVARGIVTEEMLEKIHARLRALLGLKGASLDGIYYCPYHPDGTVAGYCQESELRKPRPGMLLKAAEELDIDLQRSWMVGDSDRDVEAGRTAGCRTVLISASQSEYGYPDKGRPDHIAVNLREAANIIKKHHRSMQENRARGGPVPPESGLDELAVKSAEILSLTEDSVGEGDDRPSDTTAADAPLNPGSRQERLLAEIVEQLRRMHKDEMFTEFSLLRLLAGILQIFVPFCLLLALWFLMGPHRQDTNALLALAFAAVLQLMALTFYMMNAHHR